MDSQKAAGSSQFGASSAAAHRPRPFGLLGIMDITKWLRRLPIFPLLIAVSFSVGWYIPAYYDWTGSDQSRPSPLIGQTALGLIVGGIIVCASLPWLPLSTALPDADPAIRIRFKLRTLLLMTAAAAVVIAALMKFPMVVSGGLCAIAFCHVVRFWILHRHYRRQTTALAACMCLPYVWIFSYDEIDNILPAILWIASGLPAFFPACLIGVLIGQNPNDVMWLSVLLTGAEIVIGVWLIRLGPRRTIAYLLFVMLMSTFGSFGLNALVRA